MGISNDTPVTAGFVIGAYHRLFEIEGHSRSPRATCKLGHSTTVSGLHRCASDRRVRGAAVSRWIEGGPGWSIRKFVRPGCRYRIIETQAGDYIITGADPVPVISMKPSSHTPLSRYAEIEPSRAERFGWAPARGPDWLRQADRADGVRSCILSRPRAHKR